MDASSLDTPFQSSVCVLLVRPRTFGYDAATAESNTFQHPGKLCDGDVSKNAVEEFDAFVAALQASDIATIVVPEAAGPPRPSAVFPNNWFSTHDDGRIVIYPMATTSRRIERNPGILTRLNEDFRVTDIIDLTKLEDAGQYLEGTGSLVLDRPRRQAYACLSARTDPAALAEFCIQMGFTAITFRAVDPAGVSVYHSNVVLALGTKFAVVALEAIPDLAERQAVEAALIASGREVIAITWDQALQFCGNLLEVRSRGGEARIVMSHRAHDGFTPDQLASLSKFGTLVYAPLTTIEDYGGGSARCMLAEIFLSSKRLL